MAEEGEFEARICEIVLPEEANCRGLTGGFCEVPAGRTGSLGAGDGVASRLTDLEVSLLAAWALLFPFAVDFGWGWGFGFGFGPRFLPTVFVTTGDGVLLLEEPATTLAP